MEAPFGAPEGVPMGAPFPTPTEHRVTTPSSLRRITNAPPIMATPNPTNKHVLKTKRRSHVQLTRNNILGSIPAITREASCRPNPLNPPPNGPRRSPRIPKVRFGAIPGGIRSRNLISQEAINFLTNSVWSKSPDVFTPDKLKPRAGNLTAEDMVPLSSPLLRQSKMHMKELSLRHKLNSNIFATLWCNPVLFQTQIG